MTRQDVLDGLAFVAVCFIFIALTAVSR